jgi:hypothetical protein
VQGSVDAPCQSSQAVEVYQSENCKESVLSGVTILVAC